MKNRRRIHAALGVVAALVLSLPLTGAAQAATAPTMEQQNTPTPVAWDTCWPQHAIGNWIKNRFASCTRSYLSYKHYSCPEASCAVDSSATAYVFTLSNMVPGTRQIAVSQRMVNWQTSGTLPATAKFGLRFDCTPNHTDGTAYCDQPGPVAKTIADWKTAPEETRLISLLGEDLPRGGQSPQVQAEKRTEYVDSYTQYLEEPDGGRSEFSGGTDGFAVRCDNARETNPAYGRGSDCVFSSYDPIFNVDAKDPLIKESGTMVTAALFSSSASYPALGQGRYTPGYYGGNGGRQGRTIPLNRMFYDTAAQQAHRDTAVQSCVGHWGPDYTQRSDGLTNVCGAYPFDASLQGAGWASGDLATYAVRPVATGDYQELLSRLDTFLAVNHILDGDRYWLYPM